MAQYWQILALDSCESWEIQDLGSFMQSLDHCDFDIYLTRLPKALVPRSTVPCVDDGQTPRPAPEQGTARNLLYLPSELLLQILEELDLATCIRFAQISSHTWKLAWPILEVKAYQLEASWAGSRLICLGEACEPREEPIGLLNAAEHRTLGYGPLEYEKQWKNLYGMARERFWPLEHQPRHPSEANIIEDLGIKGLTSVQSVALRELFHRPKPSDRFSPDKVRILRNLDTFEYVRSDRLKKAFPQRPGPWVDLFHAVLVRICWSSSDRSVPVEDLTQGRWAGHRFEICWEEDLDASSMVGWEDVSSELVRELKIVLAPLRRVVR